MRVTWTREDVDNVILPILGRHRRDDGEGARAEIATVLGLDEVSDAQMRGVAARFKLGNYTLLLGRDLRASRGAHLPVPTSTPRGWAADIARSVAVDKLVPDTDPAPAPEPAQELDIPVEFSDSEEPTRNYGKATVKPAPDQEEAPRDPVEALQEKKDVRRLKSEYDRLTEMLRVEREKNAFLQRLSSHTAPPQIIRREKASGLREATALVLASDWHVEETVEAVKVQGKNEYNLEIADIRIRRFFQGIIELVEHHRADGKTKIRDVILALMGDLMTGFIHEELMIMNALTPIETILWLAPRIRNGIATVVDELDLESITIPCDPGNHGRTTHRRQIGTGCETSYEWGLYCQLAREFASDPRIRFDTTPANDHYVQVYDATLHTSHGDSVNYWGGVGGVTIPLNKAISAWNTDVRADWHAIGHFHQFIDIGAGIINGSMIGWNPFSKWIKAPYNPRDCSQHFSLIDSKRGRGHTTPIWVTEHAPARAA